MLTRVHQTLLVATFSAFFVSNTAIACGQCEYEFCTIGCVCLPKSGCIVPKEIDPGRLTEKMKRDPIGAVLNPTGPYNPTGIPLPGDVIEYAFKHPDEVIDLIQNPGKIPYTPVAAAMIASRNAAVDNGAEPIPDELMPFLRRWYSEELLNSVRWTSDWGPLRETLQAAQMTFNRSTQAITVLNAVIFRGDEAAHDPALWAHELVHVQQYRSWGVTGFAREWVNNSSTGGPVEAPAYARQHEAERLLAGGGGFSQASATNPMASGFPSGWGLSACGCWGYVNPGASQPAPQCASRVDIPRPCPGACPTGGSPWQHSCR